MLKLTSSLASNQEAQEPQSSLVQAHKHEMADLSIHVPAISSPDYAPYLSCAVPPPPSLHFCSPFPSPPQPTPAFRRDLPSNGTAVSRLTPEVKDLLDKMFDVKQVTRVAVVKSFGVTTFFSNVFILCSTCQWECCLVCYAKAGLLVTLCMMYLKVPCPPRSLVVCRTPA